MVRKIIFLILVIVSYVILAKSKVIISGTTCRNYYNFNGSTWIGLFQKTSEDINPQGDILLSYTNSDDDGNYYLTFETDEEYDNLYCALFEGSYGNYSKCSILEKNGTPYIFSIGDSSIPEVKIIEDNPFINIEENTFANSWYFY